MPLIFNASAETQRFQVFGNHFELGSKKMKMFEERIARFIEMERRYLGLVSLPDDFMDPSFSNSEQGKQVLAEKEREGIDARVKHLRGVIYNNEVSLRQDLERANIKADPKVFASAGEVAAYRELATYKKSQDDAEAAKVEEIKKLEAEIKKAGS